MTTTGGQVVHQARFLPFGGGRSWDEIDTTAWLDRGYTGHLHNDEIGLIYMNARYYVPSIGRFASADTIVPDPTNPQQFNRYAYVLNNPLRFTDPTGHISCEALGTEECNEDGSFVDSGSSTSVPPPLQLLPSYVPFKKFTTWPIDPNAPGYKTKLQGFGDTEFAWIGRTSYYRQLGRLHNAIDIFVDSGAIVVSVGDGFVVCVSCGISNPVEGETDPGIGIYHDLCS